MFYGLEKEELESNFNINHDNNKIIIDLNEKNDIDNVSKENSDEDSSEENDNNFWNC